MEWGRSLVLQLIEEFRSRPFLWDSNAKGYRDRGAKRAALQSIGEALGCTAEEAERKFSNLRSQYNRECHKVEGSKWLSFSNLNAYQPKWFAYEALQFLKALKEPQDKEESDETHEEHPSQQILKDPASESYAIEEAAEMSAASLFLANSNNISCEDSPPADSKATTSGAKQPKDPLSLYEKGNDLREIDYGQLPSFAKSKLGRLLVDMEKYPKKAAVVRSSGQASVQNEDIYDHMISSIAAQPDEEEEYFYEPVNVKKKSKRTREDPLCDAISTAISTPLVTLSEQVQPLSASSSSPRIEDDCSIFAKHIETTLRSLAPSQKALAKLHIQAILYEAEVKTLRYPFPNGSLHHSSQTLSSSSASQQNNEES